MSDSESVAKLVLSAALGATAMALWAEHKATQDKLSRTELDDPDFVLEVVSDVAELLDQMRFPRADSEAEYHEMFTEYLDNHTEFDVECSPMTPFGRPDILVGGVLAIELKVNPNKNERNRMVGQVLDYSRQWLTWIILIDTTPSKEQSLRNLLEDHGLDHIPIQTYG